MKMLQRNWEKMVFLLSLVLVGGAGYRIYLDVQEASDDQRITQTVERVQKQLDRSPKMEASDPGFAKRLSERWAPIGRTLTSKDFVIQMPALVRPVLDRVPDQRCVIPGITGFQAQGQIGGIALQWSFAEVPEEQGVIPVKPGAVDVQRRQAGDDSWSTVFSFEGTAETSYSDSNVTPRTAYEYRVRVSKGDQSCEPENAAFLKEKKYSNVATSEAKSSIELVLKSTSSDSVLVQVRNLNPDGTTAGQEGFWVEPGERIGEGDFSTPYTLKEIQNNATYSYYTLEQDTDWEGDTQRIIGVVRRETVNRPRVIYEDQSGKTYELWLNRQEEYSNRMTGQTPPWQRNDLDFDTFRIYADDVFGTPVPEQFQAPRGNGGSEEESASGDTETDGAAGNGTSENTVSDQEGDE